MTTLRQYIRTRLITAGILLVGGLALMLWSAVNAFAAKPSLWHLLGMVGVLMAAFGGYVGRLALAGPYPSDLEAER